MRQPRAHAATNIPSLAKIRFVRQSGTTCIQPIVYRNYLDSVFDRLSIQIIEQPREACQLFLNFDFRTHPDDRISNLISRRYLVKPSAFFQARHARPKNSPESIFSNKSRYCRVVDLNWPIGQKNVYEYYQGGKRRK